jgi:hypothetical protein
MTVLRATIIFSALLTLAAADLALAQNMPFAGQFQVNGGPAVTFTNDTISCSGLTPGDSVVLVGFVIAQQAGSQTITTPAFLQQADGNGAFTAVINGGVTPRSIWLFVDQATHAYTVAAPQGSVLRRMPGDTVSVFKVVGSGQEVPPAGALIHRSHTHAIRIPGLPTLMGPLEGRYTPSATQQRKTSEAQRQQITRGSAGARATTPPVVQLIPPPPPPYLPNNITVLDAKDGSALDDDGTVNGSVQVAFPDSLFAGDWLFVVDDYSLEFFVVVLDDCHLLQECDQ